MIILDEVQWAQDLLRKKQIGKKPSETLFRLARYYRQYEGRKRNEVEKLLERFIVACDPDANLFTWSRIVEAAAKKSDKYPLIQIDGIKITENEMSAIRSVSGTQRQRLLFTLLCLAKYHNAAKAVNNNWVNETLRSIMGLTGLHIPKKLRNEYIHQFYTDGLIGLSNKVDNLNMQVLFIDDNSPVAIEVTDFRNLGNQYLMFIGQSYMVCQVCGIVVRKKSNSQKYCPDCAVEMHIKQTMESLARHSFMSDSQ